MKEITKMKSLLIFVLLLAGGSPSVPQTKEQKVAASFKSVVDTISAFFKTSPKLICKSTTVRNSPTGEDVRIDEFTLEGTSFDVQKTESIISPFVGYVSLQLIHRITKNCGTLEMKYIPSKAWDNVPDAVLHANSDSCYGEQSRYDVKFLFSFQDDSWVYKNIIRTKDSEDDLIIARAFGKHIRGSLPITEPSGLQFNARWFAFAKKIQETKLTRSSK